MAEITYGLALQNGTPVAPAQLLNVGAVGGVADWELDFPETTSAAMGWYFTLPAGAALVNIVSHGVDTTAQWTKTGQRYHYYFGVEGVRLIVTVSARVDEAAILAGVQATPEKPYEVVSQRIRYTLPAFTDAQMTAALLYLRDAVRVEDNEPNNRRLWNLYLSAVRELESYCQHILFKRNMIFDILVTPDSAVDMYIVRLGYPWRQFNSLESLVRDEAAVNPLPALRYGSVVLDPGIDYVATLGMSAYDRVIDGFGEDVQEAIARLVGYRYDVGLFQFSAIQRSGALDIVSRYVNREALII